MRQLNIGALDRIYVHCSATRAHQDFSAADIRRWHMSPPLNYSDIGYHYVIKRCGMVEMGRELQYQGAHVRGDNNSIGICLIGGLDDDFKPQFNYTSKQIKSLESLVYRIRNIIFKKQLDVIGHTDTDPRKPCPCFDVGSFFADEA